MKIEIWDNSEENKCIHSFELKENETQKLSVRVKTKARSSAFIDIKQDEITLITAHGSTSFPI